MYYILYTYILYIYCGDVHGDDKGDDVNEDHIIGSGIENHSKSLMLTKQFNILYREWL